MTKFGINLGGYSPWGWIQTIETLKQGVYFVTTCSHGGVYLSPPVAEKVPQDMINKNFLKSCSWWEEDCDAKKIIEYLDMIDKKESQNEYEPVA